MCLPVEPCGSGVVRLQVNSSEIRSAWNANESESGAYVGDEKKCHLLTGGDEGRGAVNHAALLCQVQAGPTIRGVAGRPVTCRGSSRFRHRLQQDHE